MGLLLLGGVSGGRVVLAIAALEVEVEGVAWAGPALPDFSFEMSLLSLGGFGRDGGAGVAGAADGPILEMKKKLCLMNCNNYLLEMDSTEIIPIIWHLIF